MTSKDPVGSVETFGASAWRTLRATRWRLTEPPTDLPIMSPHLAEASLSARFVTGDMNRYPTKCCEETLLPLFVARAKSELEVKRASTGSTRVSYVLEDLR